MNVFEEAGFDLRRFIWVPAQTEPDMTVLIKAARDEGRIWNSIPVELPGSHKQTCLRPPER